MDNKPVRLSSVVGRICAAMLMVGSTTVFVGARPAGETATALMLSRAARPWEFLSSVGTRAGLLGDESGRMEAWVYPLKLLRDFRLEFRAEGHVVPAAALVRTVETRPESSTLVYAGDTFTVRETFFVPVNEEGAVISLEVETETPLEIEASFVRDFQLEWPASLGGSYISWDEAARAFAFGEETKKYAALVGSPTAVDPLVEYQTNYSAANRNSMRLGVTKKGRDTKLVVIAASLKSRAQATETYQLLLRDWDRLQRESADAYARYLRGTVSLELPDAQLQEAYDWSRVSLVQGMVNNPYLGKGLVAGYRTSGESQRPGFAWFFGRDSFWSSLALNAEGDFANARAAIEFISKYQRDDGKIPHEIAQSASLVPWFKDFPYAYVSADATPLYIIAVNDYVTQSGDVAFGKEKWQSVWKAYQFTRSTYNAQGFPKNFGVGHGWVEGGPLLPVETELYQSGLTAEALRAGASLAQLCGQGDASKQLTQEFETQKALVEKAFWLAGKNRYAWALDKNGEALDETSVLATAPMWFGWFDEKHASAMLTQLAEPEHQADWGMRIISDRAVRYSGGGYHYGSVWPLFTGWASVAEYKYHREFPAYANLRANALLALDGSLGHVTEVLSGDYYQPLSTSSSHQIWSAAMVVSPVLRGMMGLSADAKSGTLTFAPHTPAAWTSFAVRGTRAGEVRMNLKYTKTVDTITLQIECQGGAACNVEFEPTLSLRAKVLGAEWNGKPMAFHVMANGEDQHVAVRVSGSGTAKIRVRNDFGLAYDLPLPALGARSQGLRILSEIWTASRDSLTLDMSGVAGKEYGISLWNAGEIVSVDGAEMVKAADGRDGLRVHFPVGELTEYGRAKLTVHFKGDCALKSRAGSLRGGEMEETRVERSFAMSLRLFAAVLMMAGLGWGEGANGQVKKIDSEGHEWWHHAVFYEVYPRSFADSNGDGIGDLKGIASKLDYLKDLGVDAIWITPCFPSPQVDFGYDVSDYENIDPMYGTLADFDQLMAAANKRDIKVILDFVPNHTSDQHKWFQESKSSRTSPKRDWYIWRDGKGPDQPPNNWTSTFGGSAWKYDPKTEQYYYHYFYAEQPDLNWRNPEVRKAMLDVNRFWYKRGVAGFRLDAVDTLFEDPDLKDNPALPGKDKFGMPNTQEIYNKKLPEVHDVMRDLRKVADEHGAVLIGETWTADVSELKDYYGQNNDELQMPMDLMMTGFRELSAPKFREHIGARREGGPLAGIRDHEPRHRAVVHTLGRQ